MVAGATMTREPGRGCLPLHEPKLPPQHVPPSCRLMSLSADTCTTVTNVSTVRKPGAVSCCKRKTSRIRDLRQSRQACDAAPPTSMDIRGWLEGTADRAHPDGSDNAADPNQRILGGDLSHQKPVAHRSSRKRKRASSDSSIIATHRHGTRHAPESLRTVSPVPLVRHGSPDMRSCGASSRSKSSSKPGSRGKAYSKYERRPRHKTRPDRYEPKRKEERKQRRPRDDKELKRRKSHRNHDRSRTTGLVQSFQLKNRPKNNRLTVSWQIRHVAVSCALTVATAAGGRQYRCVQARPSICASEWECHRV